MRPSDNHSLYAGGQGSLEARTPEPEVGPRPTLGKGFLYVAIGLGLGFERGIQAKERPAVARVALQVVAVDALRVGVPFRFEQRRAEPMAGGKRERLRLVVDHGVATRD